MPLTNVSCGMTSCAYIEPRYNKMPSQRRTARLPYMQLCWIYTPLEVATRLLWRGSATRLGYILVIMIFVRQLLNAISTPKAILAPSGDSSETLIPTPRWQFEKRKRRKRKQIQGTDLSRDDWFYVVWILKEKIRNYLTLNLKGTMR